MVVLAAAKYTGEGILTASSDAVSAFADAIADQVESGQPLCIGCALKAAGAAAMVDMGMLDGTGVADSDLDDPAGVPGFREDLPDDGDLPDSDDTPDRVTSEYAGSHIRVQYRLHWQRG